MYNSNINNNIINGLFYTFLLSGSSRFFVWNSLVIELAKGKRSVEAPRPRILLLFITALPSFYVGEDLMQRGRASCSL